MKRILLLLTAVSLGSPSARTDEPAAPVWPSSEWKKVTPSPFLRTEAATPIVDGEQYLFGGFIERRETSSQIDVYDPATDVCSRKKDMPTRPTQANIEAAAGDTPLLVNGAIKQNELTKLPVLGQDRDAVIQRCGKPIEERVLQGGINWMRFQVGEFRLIVEIAPNTKQAVQIYHFRKQAFTDAEIAQLLEQNSQGKKWTGEKFNWTRSDGASSRGGGPSRFAGQGGAEEWQLVVLDPSWIKGKTR